MSEVICPYCKAENYIEGEDYPNHDGDSMEIDCVECEKPFHATMCVDVTFNAYCSSEMHNFEDKYKDSKYESLRTQLWCTNEGCGAHIKK